MACRDITQVIDVNRTPKNFILELPVIDNLKNGQSNDISWDSHNYDDLGQELIAHYSGDIAKFLEKNNIIIHVLYYGMEQYCYPLTVDLIGGNILCIEFYAHSDDNADNRICALFLNFKGSNAYITGFPALWG